MQAAVSSHFPRPLRTQQEGGHLHARKTLPTEHWICCLPDGELPASRTRRDKLLLCLLPRLWGFVSSWSGLTHEVCQKPDKLVWMLGGDRRRDGRGWGA